MAIIILVCLLGIGVLGFFTTSTLLRVIFGMVIVLIIGSFWGENQKLFPAYSERLARNQLILLVAAWAVSIGVLILGSVLRKRAEAEAIQQAEQQIEEFTAEQFVAFLDRGLASVIGTNHAWAQQNWHSLSYQEKINWVLARRPFLDGLAHTNGSAEIIAAMQKSDHRYSGEIRAEPELIAEK